MSNELANAPTQGQTPPQSNSANNPQPGQAEHLFERYGVWIERIVKLAPLLFAFVYVSGYLTLSIYYSSLGMSEVGVVKPKILSAGILYVVMVSFPAMGAFRIVKRPDKIWSSVPEGSPFRSVWKGAELFNGMMGYAFVLQNLFIFSYGSGGWRDLTFVILFGLHTIFSGAVYAYPRFTKNVVTRRAPFGWSVIALLSFEAYLMFPHHGAFRLPQLTGFLLCASCLALFVTSLLQDREKRRGDWYYQAIQIVGPLAVFPLFIYPHIKTEWGGGFPMRAIVIFSKDSVVLPLRKQTVSVIEESDNGIALLMPGRKKATFLPKGSIGAIFYSDEEVTQDWILPPEHRSEAEAQKDKAATR